MKRIIILSLAVFLFAACAPASSDSPVAGEPSEDASVNPAPESPYDPQAGDDKLVRGNAFMNSADLLVMESFPVQIQMIVRGSLPTPCHSLRAVVNTPDKNNNIEVELYSVTNPDRLCAQVLQSFEASIPMGSFPAGHYTVTVNGERIGEFDS